MIRIAQKALNLTLTLTQTQTQTRGGGVRYFSTIYTTNDPTKKLAFRGGVDVPSIGPNHPLFLAETRFRLLIPKPEIEPYGYTKNPLGGRWLTRMAVAGSTRFQLLNPLNTHDHFFGLPPLEGAISNFELLELSSTFVLLDKNIGTKSPISKKVVAGSNPDPSHPFAVLARLERQHGGGLWLWKLGGTQWTEIEGTSIRDGYKDYRILDVGYYDGKFYAFDLWSWRVGVIYPDSDSSSMDFIPAPNIFYGFVGGNYTVSVDGGSYTLQSVHLVPAQSGLYLVIDVIPKCDQEKNDLKSTLFVFVMKEPSEEEGEIGWEQVKNIGDQVFFIGYDTSFTLPSSSVHLPQWKPGSICLFTGPFELIYDGFFDASKQEIPKGLECLQMFTYTQYWRYFRLFEMGEDENGVVSFKKLPMDVYTRLFFPPPTWVKWRCPDLKNATITFKNLEFGDPESCPLLMPVFA